MALLREARLMCWVSDSTQLVAESILANAGLCAMPSGHGTVAASVFPDSTAIGLPGAVLVAARALSRVTPREVPREVALSLTPEFASPVVVSDRDVEVLNTASCGLAVTAYTSLSDDYGVEGDRLRAEIADPSAAGPDTYVGACLTISGPLEAEPTLIRLGLERVSREAGVGTAVWHFKVSWDGGEWTGLPTSLSRVLELLPTLAEGQVELYVRLGATEQGALITIEPAIVASLARLDATVVLAVRGGA